MTKETKQKPKVNPIETHIAILAEQIDRIVQMKPGLQTRAFKAVKNQLMKALK